MPDFIGALDQGTTSTRFMVFDRAGNEVSRHQIEHEQILPRPGWVEHDPDEIIRNCRTCITGALSAAALNLSDLAAVGVTNQRETTVVWNPRTGQPWHNAIVWQDTRTDSIIHNLETGGSGELIRSKTGLPPSTYFAGGKIRWLLDQVEGLCEAVPRGEVAFGTIDSWVLWNLTGGVDGGVLATDVTNASRTMLMNLHTLEWDPELLALFDVPPEVLPRIEPSVHVFGPLRLAGQSSAIPIAGILGDQQAATVGQACFTAGQAKNTYGTGNFMLLNIGRDAVPSKTGLLTTVCYQREGEPAVYALEGSIAVTGSAVQWLRDQLGIIQSAAEVETLARSVEDSGGVYFVPAFSGLFAPYWRSDARGAVVGLSRHSNRGHLARATLEAICYQTRDVVDAMRSDSGIELDLIKVDGGATVNETLMQLQSDILGVTVVRPKVAETTSLGAAYAAGLAVGFWRGVDDLRSNWAADRSWSPTWSVDQREEGYRNWKKAVQRTLGWIELA